VGASSIPGDLFGVIPSWEPNRLTSGPSVRSLEEAVARNPCTDELTLYRHLCTYCGLPKWSRILTQMMVFCQWRGQHPFDVQILLHK
jgi:hypothetical protein